MFNRTYQWNHHIPQTQHSHGQITVSKSLHWRTRYSRQFSLWSLRFAQLKVVVPAQTMISDFYWRLESKWKIPEGCSLSSEPQPEIQMFCFQINSKASMCLRGPPTHSRMQLEGYIPGWAFGQHQLPLSWTDDHLKGPLSCGISVPLILAKNHQPRGMWKWKSKVVHRLPLFYPHELCQSSLLGLSLSWDEDLTESVNPCFNATPASYYSRRSRRHSPSRWCGILNIAITQRTSSSQAVRGVTVYRSVLGAETHLSWTRVAGEVRNRGLGNQTFGVEGPWFQY